MLLIKTDPPVAVKQQGLQQLQLPQRIRQRCQAVVGRVQLSERVAAAQTLRQARQPVRPEVQPLQGL